MTKSYKLSIAITATLALSAAVAEETRVTLEKLRSIPEDAPEKLKIARKALIVETPTGELDFDASFERCIRKAQKDAIKESMSEGGFTGIQAILKVVPKVPKKDSRPFAADPKDAE